MSAKGVSSKDRNTLIVGAIGNHHPLVRPEKVPKQEATDNHQPKEGFHTPQLQ